MTPREYEGYVATFEQTLRHLDSELPLRLLRVEDLRQRGLMPLLSLQNIYIGYALDDLTQ